MTQHTYSALLPDIEQLFVMALFRVSDENGKIPELDDNVKSILRRKLVNHKSTSTSSFRNPTIEIYREMCSSIYASYGPFNDDARTEIERQLRERFAELV